MVVDTAFVSLPAADFEESCRFYGDVLGLRRGGTSDSGIRSADFDSGNLTIRIYEWKEAFRRGGHTGIHLHVASIEESQKALAAAGVEVTEVRVERWGGIVCSFSDPDGNRLDLLQIEDGEQAGR